MSTEQGPPFLVDAVRASASKMQGMKAALDARAKELDALKAQLDSERRDMEMRAARLEAERQAREGECQEIVNREEELVKLQRDWLVAFETREQELRTITEQMQARHEESAELHRSLAHLESVFEGETDRLAAERQELAAKEESLLEAQRYLATVIEAADVGPREAQRPSPPPADEPPAPTNSPPPPMSIGAPTAPEPVEPENTPEPEARPPVTTAEAMDQLTRAIEAWQRA